MANFVNGCCEIYTYIGLQGSHPQSSRSGFFGLAKFEDYTAKSQSGGPFGTIPAGESACSRLSGGKFPGWKHPWGETSVGGNFRGGNLRGGKLPRGETSGGETSGVETSVGGNFRGGKLPGGKLPGWNLPGGNFRGGNCLEPYLLYICE